MKASSLGPGKDETLDSFYHGRVRVLQKKRGYRFSLDAPLLADFIRPRATDELLELGTGNGIIPLLLSRRPFRRVTALEVQPGLAELARKNIALNGLTKKIVVRERDFRAYRPRRRFDVVFSNPPYIKRKGGLLSESEEKSIAKHELMADIFDIMRAAGRALRPDGRAYFIYPAKRKADFDMALETHGLSIRTLRFVHPRRGAPARWFLAECRFRAGSAKTLAPLMVYDESGEYTPEMKRILAGEGCGPASY